MQTRDELPAHAAFFTTLSGDAAIDNDLLYIRNLDWLRSSIGPISSWPAELLVLVNLAMLSPQPQLFLLGLDSIILYNTAYGRLLGDHHPQYLGRPIAQNTALIANAKNIDRIVDRASTKAKPANENWVPFFFLKQGFIEEVFLSATMVKLPLSLKGFHATTYDTTSEAVKARREHAYDLLFDSASSATSLEELWQSLLKGISAADDEIPFALLYSANTEMLRDLRTDAMWKRIDPHVFNLEGMVGTFEAEVPSRLDLTSGEEWIAKVNQAIATRAPTLLAVEDGTLPVAIRKASRWRCYGDDCRLAVAIPSALANSENVYGLLILGLTPRRPYDQNYQAWIKSCNRAFANLVASVTIAEARVLANNNDKRSAAREMDIITKQLSVNKQEAMLATGKVQRMLRIMELANVGVFECLPSGEIIQSNDSFYTLSGCPRQDGPQTPIIIFDHCDPQDSRALTTHWRSLLVGQSVTFNLHFRFPEELDNWVQASCVPVLDDCSNVTSIVGCITDISVQKQVEYEAVKRAEALEQLRRSEARLLKFIETAPLGIIILDKDNRCSFVNQTWLQLTSYADMCANDIDIYSFVLPADVDLLDERMNMLAASGRPIDVQLRLKRLWKASAATSSEHAWVLLTAVPDIVDGLIQQILVTITDINHFKFAESMQQARLEEAVEAKRQQENFVDMTSHEIRNPLGAVLHCTDAICQSLAEMKQLVNPTYINTAFNNDLARNMVRLFDLHREITDSVETIISCTTHQKRITDDILSLSKLDANLLEICSASFSVDSLLKQLRNTFVSEAQHARVTLTIHTDPSVDALKVEWVRADSGRIMQVLVNLITNAIKFTKDMPSTRIVTATIGVSRSRSAAFSSDMIMAESLDSTRHDVAEAADKSLYLWFQVCDTGCGLDAAGKARIFSRFTQASPKTYTRYGGSGLGLFISQKLVALQGGEIGFSSEPGAGSTFAFNVAAVRMSAAENGSTKESEIDAFGAAFRASEPSSSEQLSVLLVEDNAINQKVLKKQLIRHGFLVYTADNGQEAFDFLKTTAHWSGFTTGTNLPTIDVVLMDIEMPVVDGIECTTMIRKAQADGRINKHIPIIAVTANARKEQLQGFIEVGMDTAISKPFHVKDIAVIITQLGQDV